MFNCTGSNDEGTACTTSTDGYVRESQQPPCAETGAVARNAECEDNFSFSFDSNRVCEGGVCSLNWSPPVRE